MSNRQPDNPPSSPEEVPLEGSPSSSTPLLWNRLMELWLLEYSDDTSVDEIPIPTPPETD